jgi:hypothetical protein
MSAVHKLDSMPDPYARLETIGPERAAHLLQHNDHNRPIVRTNLARICRDLRAGEWKLNGETIVIAHDGTLMTGQHRLQAVIMTGIPIRSFVVYGVDPAVFYTVDQGTPKNTSAILSIAGEKNATKLSAVARNIRAVYEGMAVVQSTTFTPLDAIETLKAHPAIYHWVGVYVGCKPAQKIFTCAALSVLVAGAEKYGEDIVLDFFKRAGIGADLKTSEPAYLFRERILSIPATSQVRPGQMMAWTIKALKAHCTGTRIGVIRMRNDETWPEL